MGYLQASEMANSGLSLEQAVTWHLTSNHYPPLPQEFVQVALDAIEHAQTDEWDALVELPEGVLYRGSSAMRVGNVIEALHLDAFIDAHRVDEFEFLED